MPDILIALAALTTTGVIGFFVGRNTSHDSVRARTLEAEIEDARKEQEISLAEIEATKHEWKRVQAELEKYRGEVVDHFSGTSEMLHDLTFQYRAVYDHLNEGAKLLCPEGSIRIDPGEDRPGLPSPVEKPDKESTELE